MPSDNAKKEDASRSVEGRIVESSNDGVEPGEWTMTEDEIREIMASGITLADVIREIELEIEREFEPNLIVFSPGRGV